MILFYVRHGDPIYNPDQLTPLGHRQAESVAKRLALFGIDEIYASTSTRAMQTAQPTCSCTLTQDAPTSYASTAPTHLVLTAPSSVTCCMEHTTYIWQSIRVVSVSTLSASLSLIL